MSYFDGDRRGGDDRERYVDEASKRAREVFENRKPSDLCRFYQRILEKGREVFASGEKKGKNRFADFTKNLSEFEKLLDRNTIDGFVHSTQFVHEKGPDQTINTRQFDGIDVSTLKKAQVYLFKAWEILFEHLLDQEIHLPPELPEEESDEDFDRRMEIEKKQKVRRIKRE